MGSGFSKMKKQARLMEQQMESMRSELKSKTYAGSAGNGLVTVSVNGEKELKSLQIQPACVDVQDLEGLQDLIKAALEDAYQKVDAESSKNNMPFSF